MNVFMPYSDLQKSVSCLDDRRLGNQCYREGLTLIHGGWNRHPCAVIWQNYKHSLAQYCLFGLEELKKRGRYYPKWFEVFNNYLKEFPDIGQPPITLNEKFNLLHKSNLIKKNPSYYRPIFGLDIPDNLPYIWNID